MRKDQSVDNADLFREAQCEHCAGENCPAISTWSSQVQELLCRIEYLEKNLRFGKTFRNKTREESGRKIHMNGSAIIRIRKKYKLTQAQLGRLLNAHVTSVNRWERGKTIPCRKMVEKIIVVRDMGCRKIRRILSNQETNKSIVTF